MSSSASDWVVDVAEEDFQQAVIERSREVPVVVDFWAPWCGPCRMLGPLLERLVGERGGAVVLAKVNVDEAQQVAAYFGVEAIPAVKAFRDGQPVLEFVGLLPEEHLRAFLDRLSPSESDRLARRAAELEDKNPAEAEPLYRQALELDAQQQEAIVGLARLLAQQGKAEEARDLLGRAAPGGPAAAEVQRVEAVLALQELAQGLGVEAEVRKRLEGEPGNAELRYRLGCLLAARGKFEEALGELLAAAEQDRKLAADKVREAMVKIFQTVGVRSPLADEYRDKLTRLLY